MPEEKSECEKKRVKEIFDPSKDLQGLASEVERQKLIDSAYEWPDKAWQKGYTETPLPDIDICLEAKDTEKKVLEALANYNSVFFDQKKEQRADGDAKIASALEAVYQTIPEKFRSGKDDRSALGEYLKSRNIYFKAFPFGEDQSLFLVARILKTKTYKGYDFTDEDFPENKPSKIPEHQVLYLGELISDPAPSSGAYMMEDHQALIFSSNIQKYFNKKDPRLTQEDIENMVLTNESAHAAFHEAFKNPSSYKDQWVFTSDFLDKEESIIPLIQVSEAYSNKQTFEKCPPMCQVSLCIMTGNSLAKNSGDNNYQLSFDIMRQGLEKSVKHTGDSLAPEVFVEVMRAIEEGLKKGDKKSFEVLGDMILYYEQAMEDLLEKAKIKHFENAVAV